MPLLRRRKEQQTIHIMSTDLVNPTPPRARMLKKTSSCRRARSTSMEPKPRNTISTNNNKNNNTVVSTTPINRTRRVNSSPIKGSKSHDGRASLGSVSFFPLNKTSAETTAGRRAAGLQRSNSSESFAEFLSMLSPPASPSPDPVATLEKPTLLATPAIDRSNDTSNNDSKHNDRNNNYDTPTVVVADKKKKQKKTITGTTTGTRATSSKARRAKSQTPQRKRQQPNMSLNSADTNIESVLISPAPELTITRERTRLLPKDPSSSSDSRGGVRMPLASQQQQMQRSKSQTPQRRQSGRSLQRPPSSDNLLKPLVPGVTHSSISTSIAKKESFLKDTLKKDSNSRRKERSNSVLREKGSLRKGSSLRKGTSSLQTDSFRTDDVRQGNAQSNCVQNGEPKNNSFTLSVNEEEMGSNSFLAAVAAVEATTARLEEKSLTASTSTATGSSSSPVSNHNGHNSTRLAPSPPPEEEEDELQEHARLLVPQFSAVASRLFDAYFTLKDPKKEKNVCLFYGQEVTWDGIEPTRTLGHYVEYPLKELNLQPPAVDAEGGLQESSGHFGNKIGRARDRLMERTSDGSYGVKYVRPGLLLDSLYGPTIVADLVLELRIMQNLPGHPNISPLYGMHFKGLTALTDDDTLDISSLSTALAAQSLRNNAFFWITDRIQETLPERMEARWRNKQGYNTSTGGGGGCGGDENHIKNENQNIANSAWKFSQRLEVALDISSALLFLHDRGLVFHIRPEKVGFDAKHGCLKLFNFSEARQDGMSADDQSILLAEATQLSTLAYTAPEVLCHARHITTSSDVYGFGVLLWYIVSLKPPYQGTFQTTTTSPVTPFNYTPPMTVRQQYFQHVVKDHNRPLIGGKWPHKLAQLLEGCWDPYLRMTMRRVNEQLEGMLLF